VETEPGPVGERDMTRDTAMKSLKALLPDIRRRFGVRRLALFGSVARGTATDTSDLDVLVEFEGRADFERFMGLKLYLEDHLGASVDLVTSAALRERLRLRIEGEALDVA
jgi:predicted nucleotidyltransferase